MRISPIILVAALACAPASRHISTPALAPPPFSELPAPARTAWLDAAIREQEGDYAGAVSSLARARAFDPDSPWLRLKQAEIAVTVQDLASADILLAEVEAAHPEIPQLWVLKGRVQLQRQDVEGAAASGSRALALAPQDEGAWRLRLAAASAAGQSALEGAISAWRAVPLDNPAELGARGLGLASYDPGLALDDLGAAFALGSADDAVILGLAEAGVRSHRLRSALDWLARRPDAEGLAVAHARVRLGAAARDPWVELAGLRTLEAVAAAEDPGGVDALTLRGRLALDLAAIAGPGGEGRGCALLLYKNREKLPFSLVFDVLLSQGLIAEAAALLKQGGDEGALALSSARLLDAQGDRNNAYKTLSKAWKATPTPALALAFAHAATRHGAAQVAVDALGPLVASAADPELQPALLAALARAREANGEADLAAASWEALLRLDPHHPDALLASARAIARSPAGPARALPRVEEALEARPSSAEVWTLYAELLDATGDAAKADFARDNAARFAQLRRLP